MDYLKHFNLSERPFRPCHEARVFFRHRQAAELTAAIRQNDDGGIVILKGPSGAGKSSLLRRLVVDLQDQFRTVLIFNPQLTLSEILRQALTDFGHSHKFSPSTAEEELLGYFQNSAADFVEAGFRLLLAVDEAEKMSPESLAELYGLISLEPKWKGRAQLLLAGSDEQSWPKLPEAAASVKELSLAPFDRQESDAYLAFRLKAAGASETCFNSRALKALWLSGGGRPGLLGQLAERALIAAWSSGRRQVGPRQVKAAQNSLDNPFGLDYQALGRAKPALGREPSKLARPRRFLWPAVALLAAVSFGLSVWGAHRAEPQPAQTPPAPEPIIFSEEPQSGGQSPPAAQPGAPALPSPPPQLLTLPQGALALVVDTQAELGRLWQGRAKGAALKAEISAADFERRGLYLFGRQRDKNKPIVFQYPPSRTVPLKQAGAIWPALATALPQDILPLIVADPEDLAKLKNQAHEQAVSRRVKAWVQSQQYRFPDTMAELYASSFQFFELGAQSRTINRENFRKALHSEARSSGEVKLSVSQPLIMQDPNNDNLVWAIFNLKYESRLRHDMGLRVLIFEKSLLNQDKWLIVAELWLPEKSLKEQ